MFPSFEILLHNHGPSNLLKIQSDLAPSLHTAIHLPSLRPEDLNPHPCLNIDAASQKFFRGSRTVREELIRGLLHKVSGGGVDPFG